MYMYVPVLKTGRETTNKDSMYIQKDLKEARVAHGYIHYSLLDIKMACAVKESNRAEENTVCIRSSNSQALCGCHPCSWKRSPA